LQIVADLSAVHQLAILSRLLMIDLLALDFTDVTPVSVILSFAQ
jgi:hypothetical protein